MISTRRESRCTVYRELGPIDEEEIGILQNVAAVIMKFRLTMICWLSRRFASTVSGGGLELRRDQRKRALAGRAAEIKGVRTR